MAGEHQRPGEGYRCKSVEFGFSGMPGGGEVQQRAQRQNFAFRLRSMLDVEGKCFYDEFIVPWLSEAWNLVHK
eukprot:4407411-Pleurochrysis_carterae.AAC.1